MSKYSAMRNTDLDAAHREAVKNRRRAQFETRTHPVHTESRRNPGGAQRRMKQVKPGKGQRSEWRKEAW